jgi:hypothetical protein
MAQRLPRRHGTRSTTPRALRRVAAAGATGPNRLHPRGQAARTAASEGAAAAGSGGGEKKGKGKGKKKRKGAKLQAEERERLEALSTPSFTNCSAVLAELGMPVSKIKVRRASGRAAHRALVRLMRAREQAITQSLSRTFPEAGAFSEAQWHEFWRQVAAARGLEIDRCTADAHRAASRRATADPSAHARWRGRPVLCRAVRSSSTW